MGRYLRATAAIVALTSSIASVFADSSIPTCGPNNLCPESAPCCSAYGQCGVGAYCLGGCDPLFSHSLNSCVPNPVCSSQDYKLTSLSDVQDIGKYLGDSSKANWVVSGRPLAYQNQAVLLTMPPDTVGTLMASTKYVWYGKICSTMTTSQGAGVVTAFIMMSDVKDEIDFEFVGVDTQHAQSNYYSQGVTNYNNGANLTAADTSSQVHTYCIDWKPDSLSWMVDGKVLRTKNKADTWNATSNRFDYPQTPSRVMLSLWPAGLPTNGKGTIDWAGGLINWNSPYMKNGYYYAMVSEVTVECYSPPSGAKFSGGAAYQYTNTAGTNDTVGGVGKIVVLKSLQSTGENPNYDPNGSASTASGTASAAPTQTLQTVPGVVGAGDRGDGAGASQNNADSSSSNSGSSGVSTGSSGFSQGTGSTGASGAAVLDSPKIVGGSVFAILVAVAGLLAI